MLKFLVEHIFEILLSAVVALLVYIGKQEVNRVDELVCQAVSTSTEVSYEGAANMLGGLSSFDDLRDNSRSIRALQEIINHFGNELSKCGKGQTVLRETKNLVAGLHAYVNKNYVEAAKQFESMNMEKSLPHYLLGSTYGHHSDFTSQSIDSVQFRQKAEEQFSRALEIAREESGGSIQEAVLITLKCKQYLVKKTSDTDRLAVECFNELVTKKYDDYNTHYNLAALYSRQANWEEALLSFKRYLDNGGAIKDTRIQAEHDPDFAQYILTSNHAGNFKALLNRYVR